MTFEDFAGLTRDGPITREIRRQKHGVGKALGSNRGHCRMDSKLSGFIRGGAHDGAISPPGNNHRFITQFGIVALLHGRIESVQSRARFCGLACRPF